MPKRGEQMATSGVRPRVLLADDEVLVSDLVRETLEEAGYDVLAVSSAAAALAALEAEDTFTALVTDINFGPTQTGWDVATRAREIRSTIAVVYMTGDSAHEWSAHGVPQSTIVTKPFAPSQIAVAIANLLNTTDGGGA